MSRKAFDSAWEGPHFASHHHNRSIRHPGGGPFRFIREFRLRGQGLRGRFRLRSSSHLYAMAGRVRDLRVAGREPGNADFAGE